MAFHVISVQAGSYELSCQTLTFGIQDSLVYSVLNIKYLIEKVTELCKGNKK